VTDVGRVRAFIACSLDGFLAGPDDDLAWLPESDPDEDYGYSAFLAETDAILMGRGTYDVAAGFPEWPYGKIPVFVATSRQLQHAAATVKAISGTPAKLLSTVRKKVKGGIYLDGGTLIRAFLDAGALDELVVTIVPVVLGAGAPLLAGTIARHRLVPRETRTYASGLVQLRYEVVAAPPTKKKAPRRSRAKT
jgi:dihydrofolate reductase